ncbi:hypothetical protein B0O99DRAFT_679805 [Bisporella sp. PMI_857]|nr:hypothetical protein B0O99DRAFT_679805 [Bisporella sp. PMI_857]
MFRLPRSSQTSLIWTAIFSVAIWLFYMNSPLAFDYSRSQNPSINIVIAATNTSDYTWTKNLHIPNMNIIPYIMNDLEALYHPPANKGNEALAYFSYLVDFYEKMPDISIFVHAGDKAWHNDAVLEGSIAFIINNLDLGEVKRRKYMNLRVDWKNACPDWINTTKTELPGSKLQLAESLKLEEPYMKGAFLQNFPADPLPPILAQPCCSQFAVTREAILSIPLEQYQYQQSWLVDTKLSDHLSGRVWEHMWQYLFLKKAVDCPVAFKALCRGWHVCFGSEQELVRWNDLADTASWKRDQLKRFSKNGADNWRLEAFARQLEELETQLGSLRDQAIERGKSSWTRARLSGDL